MCLIWDLPTTCSCQCQCIQGQNTHHQGGIYQECKEHHGDGIQPLTISGSLSLGILPTFNKPIGVDWWVCLLKLDIFCGGQYGHPA